MTKLLSTDGAGERLDRFELVAELASGGMATVFLARLSGVAGFQRLVAIKRLHPHLAREPEFVEMFLDEARLAARIHHPNVVPIQEVGQSDQGYYLVMDYIEGETFAKMLARASQARAVLPYGVTIRVLLDTLAGLHAAHELTDDYGKPLEIVHRDVSPQNVIVGVDGVARLVDFGVARAVSRLSTTRTGQLKGKLAYMAPEQARGIGIDRRADLFSCGIVLWESLALKRLFKGDAEAETLNRVLYEPIPTPSSVRPDVPKVLEDVCMKALARDPAERYQTALELADALEKAAVSLSCMGSTRDVAQTLDQIVGLDLTQQREMVRGWLARSEPSGPLPSIPAPPVSREALTKVENPGSKSGPPPSSAPPEKVSSVSSAVIQTGPTSAQPPARSNRGLIVVVALAAAFVAGISVWGATKWPSANASQHPAATTTPVVQPTATEAPKVEPPKVEATKAEPVPATPSAEPSAKPTPGKKWPIGVPSKPVTPKPTQPQAPPDDLTNPYR